jgi:membrane-bound lytic murein transglycosylase B
MMGHDMRGLWLAISLGLMTTPSFADAKFVAYLNGPVKKIALTQGLSPAQFAETIRGINAPDAAVLKLANNQPEFTSTTGAYLAKAVTPARLEKGRDKLRSEARLLAAIEARYGVRREILLAIWGMESNFGGNIGDMKVIRSLATLAYSGKRVDFAKQQLAAAFRILRSSVIEPARFNGSWAGAMGHTQFIPTSYLASAVDWDGDGKRDIWRNHADALASTANYLKKAGWQDGVPWGREVIFPKAFDMGLVGRQNWKTFADWQKRGLQAADGQALGPKSAKAFIMLPQGPDGPAFLATQNFMAIMAYNQSHSYSIAVGHMADRFAGAGALKGAFHEPNIDLSFAERVELQKRLTRAGFNTGGSDGRFGARTYEAILAFQKQRGLALDATPSRALLRALR